MLEHKVNDRDQKKKPNDTLFPISQQSRLGNRDPGKFHPSDLLTRNYILIIPIGIYYAANLEVRIVCPNAI